MDSNNLSNKYLALIYDLGQLSTPLHNLFLLFSYTKALQELVVSPSLKWIVPFPRSREIACPLTEVEKLLDTWQKSQTKQ